MVPTAVPASPGSESLEGEEIDDAEPDMVDSPDVVTTGTEAIDQVESAAETAPVADSAPERVTPQLTTAAPDAREEAAPDLPHKDEGGKVESGK